MGFLRKTRGAVDTHPVTAFWTWWADVGHGLDPHQPSPATDELSRRVAAIHPEFTRHFGPGATSRHRLTVSAGGVAAIRPVAERWLRAAPSTDTTWEFRSSQAADPDAMRTVLEIAGHTIDLAHTEFRVDPVEDELRVHVGVHHSAFSGMPEPVREQITYLVLDWLLGEDDVERWLGHIESLVDPPASTGSPADLVAAVVSIAARRDADTWVLAQWHDEQGVPGMASCRRGLRWIDHPTIDRHQIITARYPAQENGLPASAMTLNVLREIEVELESLLASRGILVGHETHRGLRTYHVYTDSEDQNSDAALGDWASRRGLTLKAQPDPAWAQVRHLVG